MPTARHGGDPQAGESLGLFVADVSMLGCTVKSESPEYLQASHNFDAPDSHC